MPKPKVDWSLLNDWHIKVRKCMLVLRHIEADTFVDARKTTDVLENLAAVALQMKERLGE